MRRFFLTTTMMAGLAAGAQAQQYPPYYAQPGNQYPAPHYYLNQQQAAYQAPRALPPVQGQPQVYGGVVAAPPPLQQVAPGSVYPKAYAPPPVNPQQPVHAGYFATSDQYEASRQVRRVRPQWYGGLNLRYVTMDDWEDSSVNGAQRVDTAYELDGGIAASLVGGYQWNAYLRTELEAGWYAHDVASGTQRTYSGGTLQGEQAQTEPEKLEYWTYMLNQYVEYPMPGFEQWVPYLGGGIGMLRRTSGSKSESSFGWQGMAGVSYFPAERVALEAGYRYLDGGDIGAENGFDPDTISHALNLGVRVYFGD